MLSDIVTNLVAAQIGATAMYTFVRVKKKAQRRALHRGARRFFGIPGKVVIIHSTVFERHEGVLTCDYPAPDMRATRTLMTLFESAGLREGQDLTVYPYRPDRGLLPVNLSETNIVLLCGPARNNAYEKITAGAQPMRYSMTVGSDEKNALKDGHRNQQLLASRESLDASSGSAYDYGLVASLPSPYNSSKRLVILAGIHGTGTVGAAEFVADPANVRILNGRWDGGTISEVIRVDYDDSDIETPTAIRLV